MVTSAKVKQPKKLFYQRLSMPITELESKRQFKCTWVDSKLKVYFYRFYSSTDSYEAIALFV